MLASTYAPTTAMYQAYINLPGLSNNIDTIRFVEQTNGYHLGTRLSRGMEHD